MDQLPSEKHIGRDVFAAIGLAITEWSGIERALGLHLTRLTNSNLNSKEFLTAFVLTAGMDARTLIGLLRSLVTLHFPDQADKFEKLANHLEDAYTKKRNLLAHHAFATATKPDRIRVMRIKTVGRIRISQQELSAKIIREWAIEFHKLAVAVDDFMEARGLPRFEAFELKGDVRSE